MGCCLSMIFGQRKEYEEILQQKSTHTWLQRESRSANHSAGQYQMTSPALPPQFLYTYILGRQIGIGTTSKVYEVTALLGGGLAPPLACKIVDKRKFGLLLCDDAPFEQQLLLEVAILRQIRHPNIVQYHDCISSPTHLYLVTERMNGGELFQYIIDRGPLPDSLACHALRGVFSAVAYLHSQGIIHRDIKAENLLFCQAPPDEGTLKLIDFGFSTMIQGRMTGSFMGTGGYIAPEIRRGLPYTTTVDMWSMGVLVYCTVGACLPFRPDVTALPTSVEECRKRFPVAFPAVKFGAVSETCKHLILQLLEVDPNRRLTAAEALQHPWFTRGYISEDDPI